MMVTRGGIDGTRCQSSSGSSSIRIGASLVGIQRTLAIQRLLVLPAVVALLGTSVAYAKDGPILAVMEVEYGGQELSKDAREAGAEILRTELAASGKFRVVPKSRQERSLVRKKRKESYEDCFSEKCQIELGQEMAADTLLRASVVSLAGICTFSAVLIDLASSTTTGAFRVEFECTELGLRTAVLEIARGLTKRTSPMAESEVLGTSKWGQVRRRCEEALGGESCTLYGAAIELGAAKRESGSSSALSYYLKGCELDEPAGCTLAALLMQASENAATNADRIGTLRCQAAAGGDPLGILLASSSDSARYSAESYSGGNSLRSLVEKMCTSKKSAEACLLAGGMLWIGIGGDARPKRARSFLRASCLEGIATSCVWLAHMLGDGQGGGEDKQEAKRLLEQACDAGDGDGCSVLAMELRNGDAGDKDLLKARQLSESACSIGSGTGCGLLGVMYLEGEGGTQDPHKARSLLKRGCDHGNASACTMSGILLQRGLGGKQDLEQGRFYHKKGCQMGHGHGCLAFGAMLRDGKGGRQDSQDARKWFDKACRLDNSDACVNLGWMYKEGDGGRVDGQKALEFSRKACDLGNGVGCSSTGFLLHHGFSGVQPVPHEAARWYKKACELGADSGCISVGLMLQTGHGVLQDTQQAGKWYKKGCDVGSEKSCEYLEKLPR